MHASGRRRLVGIESAATGRSRAPHPGGPFGRLPRAVSTQADRRGCRAGPLCVGPRLAHCEAYEIHDLGTVAGRNQGDTLATLCRQHDDPHSPGHEPVPAGRRHYRVSGSRLGRGWLQDFQSEDPDRRHVILPVGPAPTNALPVLLAGADASPLALTLSALSVCLEWPRLRLGPCARSLDRSDGVAWGHRVEPLVSPLSPAVAPGSLSRSPGDDVVLLGVCTRSRGPMDESSHSMVVTASARRKKGQSP